MKLFTARRILALDGTEPEAFAVEDGVVVATGTRAGLTRRHPHAERVDLDGALVVPGFNDAHCHVSQAALARVRVDLAGAAGAAEVAAALRARAARTPPGEWVVGQPLDDRLIPGVDRDFLDAVSPDHPVVLIHYSFHRAVVNSRALELLGYRTAADAPDGGQLMTDAAGRLDGRLIERAWLDPWLPGPRRDTIAPAGELAAQVAALAEVNDGLHRAGITSYCDAIVTPVEQRMYTAARDRGALTPRVSMLLWHAYFDPATWPGQDADQRLQLSGVKLMYDGALTGGTCLCRHPYPSGTGTDNGLQILTDEEFAGRVRAVASAGARIAVHANGDLAISKLLDVFASLPATGAGHRVEHCSIVDDEIIARLVTLGVTPVPFSAFAHLYGEALTGFYGQERAGRICAHRSMLDAGLEVAGSSDYPIVPIDPLLGVQSMVTRRSAAGLDFGPAQRLGVIEALGVYTHGSAHATGDGRRRGRLSPGQVADFVVLDADLTAVEPDEIAATRVRSTWVGGERVWASG
ncbi:amidohydrolase [Nonomuraea sp. B10E15]|uniref:amidohydrolase n=1 Tax=Nonomuraea sp. B10E15 TaxID=3153560 RepID=UPI00325E19A2